MIHLTNGALAGSKIRATRAPKLLRATINRFKIVDALYEIDDFVRSDEKVYVYKISSEIEYYQIITKPYGSIVLYVTAKYEIFNRQPSQKIASNTDTWQKWALENWEE